MHTFVNKLPTQIFLLHGLYALHIINVSPFTDLRSFIILINYQSDLPQHLYPCPTLICGVAPAYRHRN